MKIFGHDIGKSAKVTVKNPFQITKEEIETSKAFLKEAQIDLALYDALEKSNFPDDIKKDTERRKIFLLQQAEEKAVKSVLPYFVRTTALPLLAMGVWFDEPPIRIRRVIEIYKKRVAESLEKTFNKKRLGHGLSKSFDTNRLFEDFLTVLTLVYQADSDLLEYIYESAEIIRSKNLDRVLKGQEASKIFGSLEELKAKVLKVQQEGYNKTTAEFATREFFTMTAISIGVPAQNIGLLNILEDYEQSSRYPDLPKLDENNPILKQKDAIRKTIGSFIDMNKKHIK